MKKYAVDGLDGYPNELAHMLDDALELNAELLAALKDLLLLYAVVQKEAITPEIHNAVLEEVEQAIAKTQGDNNG